MPFLKFDMRHKGPPSRAPGVGGGGCVCVGLFTTWGCHTDRLTLADMVFISLHSLPCLLSFTSTKSGLHRNCEPWCVTLPCVTEQTIKYIEHSKGIYIKDEIRGIGRQGSPSYSSTSWIGMEILYLRDGVLGVLGALGVTGVLGDAGGPGGLSDQG